MSSKRKVVIKPVINESESIKSLFVKLKDETKPSRELSSVVAEPVKKTLTLKGENDEVQAFYDQLSPSEVIAHTIAIEKLNTSYDVTRTHGFLRWKKTREVLN
jgi:hypothetical protein